MRLIDADAAIDAFDGLPNCPNGYSDTYDKACIIGVLEDLPTAQPEIIRCKDCKHYDTHDHRCKVWNHGVVVMGYCSRGEKK